MRAIRRQTYIEHCQHHYVPLHLQPWWLEAVCTDGAWDVALATQGHGRVTGVMPYYQTRRFGLPVILPAPFAPYGGPWLHYPSDVDFRQSSRYSFEQKTMTALIQQLPSAAFFLQNFHPDVTNCLPFHHAGYRQTVRYTFVFEKIEDENRVFQQFKNPLRLKLQKADRATEVLRDDAAAALVLHLHALSFQRKNLRKPRHTAAFLSLDHRLRERGQSAVFIARDRNNGSPHAGLYLSFDERRASTFLAGFDPAYGAHCALYGLYRAAICFCAERGLGLDFEGSMDAGIEPVFRSFGGRLTPYFQVWRAGNRLLEAAYWLSDFGRVGRSERRQTHN